MSGTNALAKRDRRVAEFVTPGLAADERIEAILSEGMTGMSWPRLITLIAIPAALVGITASAVLRGVFGAATGGFLVGGIVAMIIVATFVHSIAVAVTNRRVIVVGRSSITGRPTEVERWYERDTVRVVEVEIRTLFGHLRLQPAGGEELDVQIARGGREGAQAVAAALGRI